LHGIIASKPGSVFDTGTMMMAVSGLSAITAATISPTRRALSITIG
jgi:hypothetical protein